MNSNYPENTSSQAGANPSGSNPTPPPGYVPPQANYQTGPGGYQANGNYASAQYTYPASGSAYPQAPYPAPVSYPSQKSRVAAGVLAILLGSLGIHNFYLGFHGKAIAQLLISVLSFGLLAFISYIWALIEGILYLTGKDNPNWSYDAQGIPLAN